VNLSVLPSGLGHMWGEPLSAAPLRRQRPVLLSRIALTASTSQFFDRGWPGSPDTGTTSRWVVGKRATTLISRIRPNRSHCLKVPRFPLVPTAAHPSWACLGPCGVLRRFPRALTFRNDLPAVLTTRPSVRRLWLPNLGEREFCDEEPAGVNPQLGSSLPDTVQDGRAARNP
jgi:hypothetical protein